MTVKEIVEAYLKANGFDGLRNYHCSCYVDELMDCVGNTGECTPGHKIKCSRLDGKCDIYGGVCIGHIDGKKPL